MKLTLSNTLIIISIVFSLVSFQNNEILIYGMNNFFLLNGDYVQFFIQLCFYSFIHLNIMHLLFNSLFLYIFGNKVEEFIGKKLFINFFVLTTIFNAIFLLIFSNGNTIGISGFGMALLSFYTLTLHQIGNSEYKGGITAIIINILIGFTGNISLVGHLSGAIFGGIYFLILKIIGFYNKN